MAMSSAERQARYRKARAEAGENGEVCLNMWVTTATASSLRQLAHHHGMSQRKFLENLVAEAVAKVTPQFDWDSPEWHAYLDGGLRKKRTRSAVTK